MTEYTSHHGMEETSQPLSRRALLRRGAAAGALALATNGASLARAAEADSRSARVTGGEPRPREAVQSILDALGRAPLVAMTERHCLQEMHDLLTGLLRHPDLPGKIDDIVVEFGNAYYQNLMDRFILQGQPVAKADLEQVWRQIGDPTWNAPVYEQFFRTVRAVNWALPPARRIRVLLGQPPVTMSQIITHPRDRALLDAFIRPMDDHYAAVVEREVLAKGRKALLIAGGGHTLRGLHMDGDQHGFNAVTRITRRHPGAVFVIDLLLLPPGPRQDATARRVQALTARWPRPAVALLAGTWLGAVTQSGQWINAMGYRAVSAAAARYEAQADAVLYLGPGEALTASQADPAIYHWGAYPQQVRRSSAIAGAGDQVAFGLHLAQAAPNWFAQFTH